MALTKEKNKRDRFLGLDMPWLSLVQGCGKRDVIIMWLLVWDFNSEFNIEGKVIN